MAIDSLVQQGAEVIGVKRRELADMIREAEAAVGELRTETASASTAFAESQEAQGGRFNVLMAQHEAMVDKLREKYHAEHALRAPLAYWSGKQEDHRAKGNDLRKYVFGGIAGALLLEFFIAWLLFACTSWPDPLKLSLLALSALLSIWSIRLLVRVYLSHLHLETDAAERVVMLQTYLALVDGNHLSDKEDRKLVLEPLFRPTGDGIVKDEGLPPSIAEFFSRSPKA